MQTMYVRPFRITHQNMMTSKPNLSQTKAFKRMFRFMILPRHIFFGIILSEQITDTFISIYIHFPVRHLLCGLLKCIFQMSARLCRNHTTLSNWVSVIPRYGMHKQSSSIHPRHFFWRSAYLKHFVLRPTSKYFTRDIIAYVRSSLHSVRKLMMLLEDERLLWNFVGTHRIRNWILSVSVCVCV